MVHRGTYNKLGFWGSSPSSSMSQYSSAEAHHNSSFFPQLQVAGIMSEVTAVTLETKPQGKMRNILHDLTKDYHDGKVRTPYVESH